ncbi:rhamnulokinase [Tetragenococcus halophilus]|nr:rhamnulokinase [Tetragenococcus halophilus]
MDYIAIDIGASSGRLIHANFHGEGGFKIEEIHRFKNGFRNIDGVDRWDLQHLIREILIGLQKAKFQGIEKCYVGIDTWAVDYGLVDKDGKILGDPASYRDHRTNNVIGDFKHKISLDKLYKKNGIQLLPFNTVFQLFVEDKDLLSKADKLLLMPDLLGYIFTGNAVTEKTNASTMALLNLHTRNWDREILEAIHIDEKLFAPLVEPGFILGDIQADKFPEYDLPKAVFITVATHDTASAIIGTPANYDNWAYISSGTWSLLGMELSRGISTKEAFEMNYTNEWGVQGNIRFLKNIMGMWLIQEVVRNQNHEHSYSELVALAEKEEPFQQFIDINDERFLNPGNMIQTIQEYCYETKQSVPKTSGELARAIYDNLALYYAVEIENLEKLSECKIDILHIVGGGSNNKLLNQLTADVCNIPVEAGPSEATAIGNLMVQMIATKGYGTLESARQDIRNSIELETFQPRHSKSVDQALVAYKNFLEKNQRECV